MHDVERRLRACELRWGVRADRRMDGGCGSDVYAATGPGAGETVVKLARPSGHARVEAAALAAWAGTGCAVRVVDTDFALGALLLERVRPGTHLPPGNDEAAVKVAAELLAGLHGVARPSFPFADLAEAYDSFEARALDDVAYERRTRGDGRRGEAGLARMPAARAAAMALAASAGRRVLLHGDFIDKNVFRAGEGYVAADPLPHIGDPHSDIGFFAAYHPPATGILERAEAIAALMGLDGGRARRWAAVWAVHQGCQAWREDQAELDAVLEGGDVDALLVGD